MPRHQRAASGRSGAASTTVTFGSDYGLFRTQVLDCGVSLEGRDPAFQPHEEANDYVRHLRFDWGLFEVGAVFAAFTTVLTTLAVMVGILPV